MTSNAAVNLEFVNVSTPPRSDGGDALHTVPLDNNTVTEATSFLPSTFLSRVSTALTKAKAFKEERMKNVRPWSDFFDRSKISLPTKTEAVTRATKNIRHYYSNYLIVAGLLSVYVAVTNLNFVLSMVLCAAMTWYYRVSTSNGEPFIFRGQEITPAKAYATLGTLTLFLFWITGGSGTVFWLVMGSAGVVLTHAAMRDPPPLLEDVTLMV